MRSAFIASLVIANGLLWWSSRGSARERQALESRLIELSTAASRSQERVRLREETGALVDSFTKRVDASQLSRPLDIATIRDELIGMEEGLALDRLSLDFRADDSRASEDGSNINATLRGRFSSIQRYLARIEASALPLATRELQLRGDDELVSLDARWSAVWRVSKSDVLAPTEVARLESWLSRGSSAPERNLFEFQSADYDAGPDLPLTQADRREETTAPPPIVPTQAPLPELTGFVLARPELEPDVHRRVLAAVRFKGELHLLQVGDDFDGYALEQVEPLESVTLLHSGTGERLVLRLP
ncbi:MAG TPA: hypothetical protein VLK65_31515 [Vicinamibacteria bacterium]|nr:hypothetical protein [Vicinamibacteria bacterium]